MEWNPRWTVLELEVLLKIPYLSGIRAGGRSRGSPGPREDAGPGRDIGLWTPVLLLCWCLDEEGVPAALSPPPYNLANSEPVAKKLGTGKNIHINNL